MVRCANCLVGFLNLTTFLFSILILGGGIWLGIKAETDCEKSFQWTGICIGAVLMVVSLAGLVGTCCRIPWLLWFYLCVMFLLILLLFCSTVFSFVVTKKSTGEEVSNGGNKEYRLGDYSHWLRKRVDKASHWRTIKSCIQDDKVCKNLGEDSVNEDAKQFYKKSLSPIQWGCCKPPTACGFSYVNATYWLTSATSAVNRSDSDCGIWSNDQGKLCYDCSSCKAGVLEGLQRDWRKDAIIDVASLVALVVVFCIGCCALRNSKRAWGRPGPLPVSENK